MIWPRKCNLNPLKYNIANYKNNMMPHISKANVSSANGLQDNWLKAKLKKRKRKVFPEPYGPQGGADLRFLRPSARHQFLHCETMDTGLVYRTVCLFTSQWWSRYQIILLGDRGTCVWTTYLRSLPGSAEWNLRLWVTSGLQVRHVTVRLPSHTQRQNY